MEPGQDSGWRYVLLDRDGVINQERPDYVKSAAEFTILPGAVEAIARITQSGRSVVVVTNQSAIAQGLVSRVTVDHIHEMLNDAVRAVGGNITAFMICPHGRDDGCSCRKPAPGLFFRARDEVGVDLARTVAVGDHASDLEAASAAGCDAILIDAVGDKSVLASTFGSPRVRDLGAAAELICGG
jgi:D-glycero-D-manno-heptose 1,7-bisphosphate phosphatase